MTCGKPKYSAFPNICPYDFINPKCEIEECTFFKMDLKYLINKNSPLVSIIIPFYNKIKYVLSAIESVLLQTYENWELIIVNDGSNKYESFDLRNLIENFNSNRIHLVELDGNYGQAYARNEGFCHSAGYFIGYLDADDMYTSNHIEVCLLKLFEGYRFVYGNFWHKVIDEYSVKVSQYDYENCGQDFVGKEKEYLKLENPFAINSVMHDRRLFVAAGGFEEGVVCGEDGVLWRRMSEIVDNIGFYREPTTYYCRYIENKSISKQHQSSGLKEPEKIKGIHLIGKGTNGQELDNQENYQRRVDKLKKYVDNSIKLDYIDLED